MNPKQSSGARPPSRILILQTAFLGDVILSTPLIRAVRRLFPDARVDVLVIPENKSLFQYDPNVDQVLTFNKRKVFFKWAAFFKTLSAVRKHRYEAVISLQRSMTSSWIMVLGGIPLRAGRLGQRFLNRAILYDKSLHVRDRYLGLLRAFSDRTWDRNTALYWSKNEEQKANALIAKAGGRNPKVGIAPGSRWNTKRWPLEYYAELTRNLEKAGAAVFLIGGREDGPLCDALIRQSQSRTVNTAGRLSILESAALIDRLDLLITNDSAPLHIADAVDTPVIAIFGPTVQRFGCTPYRDHDRLFETDLECRPCGNHGGNRCPRKHFRCMRDISPDQILRAAMDMLKEIKR